MLAVVLMRGNLTIGIISCSVFCEFGVMTELQLLTLLGIIIFDLPDDVTV